MSVEINAIIAELQQQIAVFSSRAAQHAGALATMTAERDALKKECDAKPEDKQLKE